MSKATDILKMFEQSAAAKVAKELKLMKGRSKEMPGPYWAKQGVDILPGDMDKLLKKFGFTTKDSKIRSESQWMDYDHPDGSAVQFVLRDEKGLESIMAIAPE